MRACMRACMCVSVCGLLKVISELVVCIVFIVVLFGDYFCKILLEGSTDLTLEDNMLLFDIFFSFIDESGRFNHQNEVLAQNNPYK